MNTHFKILLKTLIGLLLGWFMLSMFTLCSDPENEKPQPPVETSLSAPTEVKATQSGSSVVISWNAVTSATNYEVFRSNSATGTYSSLTSVTSTNATDASPLNSDNYYKVKALKGTMVSDFSNYAYYKQGSTGGSETGKYMGIIGFNEALNIKDISVLANSTKRQFELFVDGMQLKAGTLLYYSVDEAINKLQTAILPNDLVNVSIVTFTDGLDQGSLMLKPNYQDKVSYRNAVHNRISTTKIKNLNITAYSVGFIGSDVGNNLEEFEANLENLASSPKKDYVYTIKNINELLLRFDTIATSLYNISRTETIKLKIPGQENGAKIRFTFDNVTNAANSNLYIEGIFNLSSKSLQNVVYHGLSSSSGATVSGDIEGIFVTYTFVNIKDNSSGTVPKDYIQQWEYKVSQWQKNSEFSRENNTETIVNEKSAVIMLVLDCSSSLGNSDFKTMKDAAIYFIDVLLGDKKQQNALPSVSTSSATNITQTTATLGGNITSAGIPAYTEKGVCYSTSQNPTISNTKLVASGSGTGSYSVSATGLNANTTYYVRAYATNSQGTVYGSQVSFTTNQQNNKGIIYSAYTDGSYIYCNGIYPEWNYSNKNAQYFEVDLGGSINRNNFNISLDFLVQEYRSQWVLVLSNGYRLLGLHLTQDAKIQITTNNQDYYYNTNETYQINIWKHITIEYSNGYFRINNGNYFAINMKNPSDCTNELSSVNWSNGISFKGYLSNIIVSNLN